MDLFKVYKAAKQRLARHPYSDDHSVMCNLAREMSKRRLQGSICDGELLAIAEEFAAHEQFCSSGIGRYYGEALVQAIIAGDVTNDVPYSVQHQWLEKDDHTGFIYIATSYQKPGQCKLGATTMRMEERLEKYQLKYGYPIEEYWSNIVKRPFYLEKLISDAVRDKKSAGVARDDSIEWFRINPAVLRRKVMETIALHHLHLRETS